MRTLATALLICFAFCCLAQKVSAQTFPGTNDDWDFISANRMLLWVSNSGRIGHNPLNDGSGLEWPRGSGRYIMFTAGMILAGKVNSVPHVCGASWNAGWQAGVILPDGTADDPSKPEYRIYHAHRFRQTWWDTLAVGTRSSVLQDLQQWPVQHGAPWTDQNRNGIYDPDTTTWKHGNPTDGPRLRGDEMLWFVSNHLDSTRSYNLYGTPPSAIEMHTLIWASSGHPLLENVIFREHTYINKGSKALDDASIATWEDPDHGDAFDDFIGVDTSLGLVLTYNGLSRDEIYGLPPAAGTLWLQTPIVAQPGSVARFGDRELPDHANLPLSSYVHYIGGSSIYREPNLKNPQGAVSMLNNMDGNMWNGNPYMDPLTGLRTPFLLAGDPVRGTGWVDGIVNSPGDRRYLCSSGAFTFAPGDTQKTVVASIADHGGNQLLSVRALRNAARKLQDIHRNLPFGAAAPVFDSELRYSAQGDSYIIQVRGGPFPSGTSNVAAVLRNSTGTELLRVAMHDDGQHDDGGAGDGLYGGTLSGALASEGADLFILTETGGVALEWFVDDELPITGPASVSFTDLMLDNPSHNGSAQPGEYLRFKLRIDNNAAANMDSWHIFFRGEPSLNVDRAVQRYAVSIPSAGHFEPEYDADSMHTFVGITLPDDTQPGTYVLPVTLMSDQHCVWEHELLFTVDTLPGVPQGKFLEHVEGNASGTLGYVITDRSALTDHMYRVSVEGEDHGLKTLLIEDTTLGTTLFNGWTLPNRYYPLTAEIDGWKITMGTAFEDTIVDETGRPSRYFTHDADWSFSPADRPWFTVYDNDLFCADEQSSALQQYDLVPVQLVFDRQNGQKAVRYLRGTGYTMDYAGYHEVPVRAYDVSDPANPRQLMLGFSEYVDREAYDSTWMPTTDIADRELLYIFGDDYSTTVPDDFRRRYARETAETTDQLYLLAAVRDATAPMFEDGDSFLITPRIPVSNRDVYILARPKLVGTAATPAMPSSVALLPTYPNPSTNHITVPFELAAAEHVRLSLHDLHGREVAVLADRMIQPGQHSAEINTANLPSGAYYLVLRSVNSVVTRKLLIGAR